MGPCFTFFGIKEKLFDSFTLVFICIHSSSDSSRLVYTCLHLSSDSSVFLEQIVILIIIIILIYILILNLTYL